MRHVQIDEFGPPAVLHLVEVPDLVPGPGQVLVRTAVAGITFVETQVRAGWSPRPGGGPKLPVVLGNGVAGEIVAVGEGVDTELRGQRVITATGGFGSYADQAVVNAADPIRIPDRLDWDQAVALLADGRTALALARAAGIGREDRVLVTAAAGGVGSLLVQLARAAGAQLVVAAASGERKLRLARELGADLAIDYESPRWAETVRAEIDRADSGATRGAAGGIDVVFDGVGGHLGQEALALVGRGTRLLRYGAASGAFTDVTAIADRGVIEIAGHSLIRSPADNRQLVEQALAEAAAGRLRPIIGQTFPLANAAAAHAAIEARQTLGKTILIP
jgi:NADPH2:quinone reductase